MKMFYTRISRQRKAKRERKLELERELEPESELILKKKEVAEKSTEKRGFRKNNPFAKKALLVGWYVGGLAFAVGGSLTSIMVLNNTKPLWNEIKSVRAQKEIMIQTHEFGRMATKLETFMENPKTSKIDKATKKIGKEIEKLAAKEANIKQKIWESEKPILIPLMVVMSGIITLVASFLPSKVPFSHDATCD